MFAQFIGKYADVSPGKEREAQVMDASVFGLVNISIEQFWENTKIQIHKSYSWARYVEGCWCRGWSRYVAGDSLTWK